MGLFLTFIINLDVHVCAHTVPRYECGLQELVLSSTMGLASRNLSQVIRLGNECLCPLAIFLTLKGILKELTPESGKCYQTSGAVGIVGLCHISRLLSSPVQPWTTYLWDLTGFSYNDLTPCVLSLHKKW